MINRMHDWVIFFGRFHPVLVHLPIGGLVLLGLLELLAKFARFTRAAQGNRLILGLVTAAAITTALLGWMLSRAGGYDPHLLPWHKWTGIALAVACTLTWLLLCLGRLRAYRLSLAATLAILVVASHLGASITHGRDFLTQYAPAPLRALLGGSSGPATAAVAAADLTRQQVFIGMIHPILERRCLACHGPEKHKAGLSMESYATLLQGGQDGPVLVAGKPLDSALIQRLLLPLEDEDHMPPQGKPQPTLAEIAALQWWIGQGAPADKTVGDLKPGPEVQRLLGAAVAGGKY
jgi:uncharacterized membrane protein